MKKLPYLTVYKTHRCIRRTPISAGQIKEKTNKKQQLMAYIKRDEIDIMNIINDNTFNPYNNLWDNDNK